MTIPTNEPTATAVATTTTTTATIPMIRVIAPATLPEGATFEAVVDGIRFTARVPAGGVAEGEAFPAPYPSSRESENDDDDRGRTVIRVRSPEDLNAGDRFEAAVPGGDGIRFTAVVPVGGARKGEIFETDFLPLPETTATTTTNTTTTVATRIEIGRWRTELSECCDCSRRSCCQLCAMATFCGCVVMGQVMERLHLGLGGCPAGGGGSSSTADGSWYAKGVCSKLVLATACVYGGTMVAGLYLGPIGYDPSYLLWFSWTCYLLIAFSIARRSMRDRYRLPETCCGRGTGMLDDLCVTFWCSCCSSIQMACQTHDPEVHPYESCSPTGLPRTAPQIV